MEGDRIVQLLKEAGITTNDPRFKAATLAIVREEIAVLENELPEKEVRYEEHGNPPQGETTLASDRRLRSFGCLAGEIRTKRNRLEQLKAIEQSLKTEGVKHVAVPVR